MQWHAVIKDYHKVEREKNPGKSIISSASTGATSAYLSLSYNIYLRQHNVKLQEVFIKRRSRTPITISSAPATRLLSRRRLSRRASLSISWMSG
jgi:hypothetical protein